MKVVAFLVVLAVGVSLLMFRKKVSKNAMWTLQQLGVTQRGPWERLYEVSVVIFGLAFIVLSFGLLK